MPTFTQDQVTTLNSTLTSFCSPKTRVGLISTVNNLYSNKPINTEDVKFYLRILEDLADSDLQKEAIYDINVDEISALDAIRIAFKVALQPAPDENQQEPEQQPAPENNNDGTVMQDDIPNDVLISWEEKINTISTTYITSNSSMYKVYSFPKVLSVFKLLSKFVINEFDTNALIVLDKFVYLMCDWLYKNKDDENSEKIASLALVTISTVIAASRNYTTQLDEFIKFINESHQQPNKPMTDEIIAAVNEVLGI